MQSIKVETQHGSVVAQDIRVGVRGAEQIIVESSDRIIAWQRETKKYGLVFTGTQYIDTGIVGQSGLRVVVDCIMTATENNCLYGARAQTTSLNRGRPDFFYCYVSSWFNQGRQNRYIGYGGDFAEIPSITTERVLIDQNRHGWYIDNELLMSLPTEQDVIFNTNTNLLLGAIPEGTFIYDEKFIGNVYSFRVYLHDTLVRNFIPVPQGSTQFNNIPAPANCMWCAVTQQYYLNIGSGNFDIIDDIN